MSTGEMVRRSLPGPFALFSLSDGKKRVAEAEAQMAAVKGSFRSLTLIFDGSGKLKDFQFSPPILASTTDASPLIAATPTR